MPVMSTRSGTVETVRRTYSRRVTPRQPAHVLVVDDEPQVRATVREALRYEGYVVTEAENGAEALAAIANAPPDLVLIDLWMPVMDGWQLRRRLLESHPHLPVIVLSAVELKSEDLIRLEADAVIEKPFDLDDLYAAISDALARR
jgi:CheY-like chemotaxis protein